MQTVLIVIHLMVVLAMIGAVLLQKSEGGGLGMGGSGGGFLTSRGSANVLTRTTAILALVFFTTSLALSILASVDRKPSSILNTGAPTSGQPAPGAPQAPLGQGGGGILPQLQGRQPPAEPQVPPSR
jgi:preprotein translocase subunit SecG